MTFSLMWENGPNNTHVARGPGAAYYLAEGPFHTKVFVCANGVTTTSLGRADTVEQAKELAQRHAEEVRQ